MKFLRDNRNVERTAKKECTVNIGSTAPNTGAAGFTSSSKGETWLDTVSTQIFKIYDGAAFQTVKAVASVSAGQPANPINGQLHWDTAAGGAVGIGMPTAPPPTSAKSATSLVAS